MIRLQIKFCTNILKLPLNRDYDRKNRFITIQKLAISTCYLFSSWPFFDREISIPGSGEVFCIHGEKLVPAF